MKIENNRLWAFFVVIGMIYVCGCIGGPDDTTTLPSETTTPQSGTSIESIFDLGKPSGYSVLYDMIIEGEDGINQMTQNQYVSGENFRFDIKGIVEGQSAEVRLYNVLDGTYTCMDTDGTWTCFGVQEQDYLDDLNIDDMTSEIENDISKSAYDGTQSIAGVTAKCFRVTISDGSMKYCLHPDYNIPLLIESTDKTTGQDGYYKMVATEFKLGQPDDSVFELPAEAMDLSGICRDACMQMPAENREACLANC